MTTPPHKPKILWIGCSDARVPESVMWSPPKHAAGEIFVQRNIANQFHLTDNNAVSVLTYGVTGITGSPIQEIRIVGHTDCGGVKACYHKVRSDDSGISKDSVLWTWLGPLKRLAALHLDKSMDQLAAINVEEQMKNVEAVLASLDVKNVPVKGFIYNVTTGKLEQIGGSVGPGSSITGGSVEVYTGKFNYSPYASNENMFVVFVDGWVERGRVLVYSTFTRDAAGVDKRPFDLDTNGTATKYVLQAQDPDLKKFTIRDIDQAAYYHFTGTRNNEDNVTITMRSQQSTSNLTTIQLAKLK